MTLQRCTDGLPVLTEADAQRSIADGPDLDALRAAGIACRELTVPLAAFEAFEQRIDYAGTFPRYASYFTQVYDTEFGDPTLVRRKYFEQFLSIWLTEPGPGDVTVDIAAHICPFSAILKSFYGVGRSYHQDLTSLPLEGAPYLTTGSVEIVQGNAAALPFEEDSLDKMFLLNSWEHFQAPSDLGFLQEAARCLKPGGQMVVVPLSIARKGFVQTDPSLWRTKQVYEQGKDPLFRCAVPVLVTDCGQVYDQFHDAGLLVGFAAATPALRYELLTITLDRPQPWFDGMDGPDIDCWHVLMARKPGPGQTSS